jgi:hypothetical protein
MVERLRVATRPNLQGPEWREAREGHLDEEEGTVHARVVECPEPRVWVYNVTQSQPTQVYWGHG